MRACVVVCHREEIEAKADGVPHDLLDGVQAIGVDGVAMQIAFEPVGAVLIRGAVSRCFDRLTTNRGRGVRTRWTGRSCLLLAARCLLLLNRHRDVASNALRLDAVDTDRDAPLARKAAAVQAAG